MADEISAIAEREFTALQDYLGGIEPVAQTPQTLGECLQDMVSAGLDRLPMAGGGRTLDRWRCLARVAAHDLSLVKLFEGHTDALAIMSELHGAESIVPAGSTWGMWAAEPPYAKVALTEATDGGVELNGRKAWCSGAPVVSHALLTAWNTAEQQCLAAVPLDQAGVQVTDSGWRAVGMAISASVEVVFSGATGVLVGAPGDYTGRRGFWYGGAGIAACWYGAAAAIGKSLVARAARRSNPHIDAHLGAVDAELGAARAALHEVAAAFDQRAYTNAAREALRTRAITEQAADNVIKHTGRALGATPFCRDEHFARLVADLPVFMRQSHAERDLETIGRAVAHQDQEIWRL